MNIIFEKFTEKHINEAIKLALAEFSAECRLSPHIPCDNYQEKLSNLMYWLCSQPFGKAAICDEKLVGYLLFAGPWDGFFGDVKGVFSPLGGSAFSYEYKNRARLASMLFANVSEEFVRQGVYSCALSRYAHDEEVARAFVLNGFGIRCADFVRKTSGLDIQSIACSITFEELTADEFRAVEHLQRGLHKHLANAPVFFPENDFDEWFEHWVSSKTMRIFVAKSGNEIIGFISIDDTAENFITEYDKMKNICGAYFDEKYRGNGFAQGLLAYIVNKLKEDGITHLGVDCETLNPTALNFWGKYFEPYTYSFARRIDERVKN